MEPIEIIYNGYIEERENIDTEETNEAADNLMGMIESLLPNSDRMRDVLFTECLHLAELSQKQGFMCRDQGVHRCNRQSFWQKKEYS